MWAASRVPAEKFDEWQESLFMPLPGETRATVRPDDVESEHALFAASM